jgi:hypothetical protein
MLEETDRATRAERRTSHAAIDSGWSYGPSPTRSSSVRTVPVVALTAFVSAVSAWVHAAAIRPHLEEYRPFGVFFIIITALQVAWTFGILLRPGRRLFVLGAIGNAALALLWLVSRTKGLPIGPEPWTPEAVGWADLLSTVCEVVAAVGSVVLLRQPESRRLASTSDPRSTGKAAPRDLLSRVIATAAVVCIAGTVLTVAGLAPSLPHEHGEEEMSGAAEAPALIQTASTHVTFLTI